ncbi:transcriptional regulator [Asanoa ishikariensis]|uniref:Helix-turn-helix domain-containing protein n=1 Tax=Asanoa ishikariensis TaxID=137265 RepID=A0A1H3MCA6_9ACTN|nr:winged helix-turn-helix domain-containing protein [Asanoa ishikariensis]GIF66045.1 transcriptional regulator [Asanoa ishikariensis]SDY74331.1 Helix-turn-helix domain-containing protein [Asanoa ishikariensis]
MLRIHFTRDDVARTRVAPGADPVWELILSLQLFQGRRADRDPLLAGWRREVAAGLRHGDDGASVRLLFALNPPQGYFPDFLTPFESRAGLLPGLDAIRSTPAANLRRDLTLLAAGNRLPASAGDLARGDVATLHRLTASMEDYRALALAPYWSRIESAVEADRSQRARAMLADGADGLLTSLRPAMRWDGQVLEVRHYPADRDLYLDGRGLLLVPAFFCARTPVSLVDPNLPPVLVYPVERLGGLDQPAEPGRPALAALLGRTRARVLEVVAGGCSTGEIARRLEVSAAAASQHAAVLRNAGLLVSRRDGNTMVHTLTPLGRAMLD